MYAGQHWYDASAATGVQSRRRNPKRKNRLPYHAKQHTAHLPILTDKRQQGCAHALAMHQDRQWKYLDKDDNPRERTYTTSYALPCVVKHGKNTKKIVHKDTNGRTWS